MIHYYLEVLRKYATFSGRARRAEYWYFVLANLIIYAVFAAIGVATGKYAAAVTIYYVYMLAVLIPSLAVSFRRLHDTDRSAWWLLIDFVPIVGIIILIIFFAEDSTPGDNRFGPNPKGVAGAAEPIQAQAAAPSMGVPPNQASQ